MGLYQASMILFPMETSLVIIIKLSCVGGHWSLVSHMQTKQQVVVALSLCLPRIFRHNLIVNLFWFEHQLCGEINDSLV